MDHAFYKMYKKVIFSTLSKEINIDYNEKDLCNKISQVAVAESIKSNRLFTDFTNLDFNNIYVNTVKKTIGCVKKMELDSYYIEFPIGVLNV